MHDVAFLLKDVHVKAPGLLVTSVSCQKRGAATEPLSNENQTNSRINLTRSRYSTETLFCGKKFAYMSRLDCSDPRYVWDNDYSGWKAYFSIELDSDGVGWPGSKRIMPTSSSVTLTAYGGNKRARKSGVRCRVSVRCLWMQ